MRRQALTGTQPFIQLLDGGSATFLSVEVRLPPWEGQEQDEHAAYPGSLSEAMHQGYRRQLRAVQADTHASTSDMVAAGAAAYGLSRSVPFASVVSRFLSAAAAEGGGAEKLHTLPHVEVYVAQMSSSASSPPLSAQAAAAAASQAARRRHLLAANTTANATAGAASQTEPTGLVSLTAFKECRFDDLSATGCIVEFKDLRGKPEMEGQPLYLVIALVGANKVRPWGLWADGDERAAADFVDSVRKNDEVGYGFARGG